MKKIFTILLLAALTTALCHAAKQTSAADVLAACAAKIEKAPSFDIQFLIQADNASLPATLTLSGQKFVLDCDEMSVWYDGLTQWTFSKKSHEVSITEPEPDELAICNPFAILAQPEAAYNIRRLEGAAGLDKIELVPKNSGLGLRRAILTIDSSTSLPTETLIVLESGRTIKIKVIKAAPGRAHAPGFFRWESAKAPATRVNDLR